MALLETHDLTAFYGHFQALYGISLTLQAGETVAIIGANGAGKTTFLKTVVGLIKAQPSAVQFAGEAIGSRPAADIVRRGIALVPEGRRLFPSLSVEENLLVGGYVSRHAGPWGLERVYQLFPALAERRDAPATALSGGQQQMVAIGRGLMSNPRLLLCDELSLGLAPVVIRDIYASLPAIAAERTAVILVEQDISRALDASVRFYCFLEGRLALSELSKGFDRTAITAAYFGF